MFVYQRNECRKEGQNRYTGTDDQANQLDIGIHRQLDANKMKILCIKEIMMNMIQHSE